MSQNYTNRIFSLTDTNLARLKYQKYRSQAKVGLRVQIQLSKLKSLLFYSINHLAHTHTHKPIQENKDKLI